MILVSPLALIPLVLIL